MGIPKAEIITALQKSDLSETVRAEKLTMDDLARLYDNLLTIIVTRRMMLTNEQGRSFQCRRNSVLR